jgi:hypothetical protein
MPAREHAGIDPCELERIVDERGQSSHLLFDWRQVLVRIPEDQIPEFVKPIASARF